MLDGPPCTLEILHSEKIRSECVENQLKTFTNKQKVIPSRSSILILFFYYELNPTPFKLIAVFLALLFFSVCLNMTELYSFDAII